MSILPYSTGNMPVFRFYVFEGPTSLTYEVFPLKFLETSLVDELESGCVFYRRKFNGTLVFGTNSEAIDEHGVTQNRHDDWLLFWGFEQHDPCATIYLVITKTVAGVTETYWEGFFSTTDGKFDVDQCIFEVTPITIDDYTDILDLAGNQYNIFDTAIRYCQAYIYNGYATTGSGYNNNRWLARIGSDSVLEYLADQISPGCTVSSDFFTADPNPVTLTDSRLLYLQIGLISEIISPPLSTGTKATSALMSWNELMAILWAMFQVTWNYDSLTDTINVEHISWAGFAPAAGIDLRTQLMTVATNKYSYSKDGMYKYERFSFAEANNAPGYSVNFIGLPIVYNSACINQNVNSNSIDISTKVTTDLEYIVSAGYSGNTDGFIILCARPYVATYTVWLNAGIYFDSVMLNMDLSWSNLQNSYYRHNRILLNAIMNGDLVTFWSAKKFKRQECAAIICDDFDPSEEITTELGQTYFGGEKAIVQSAELKPSGETKLNLLYGPKDNINTGVVDYVPYARVDQDGDMLYATLTELAPAGNLEIELVVTNCAGVPGVNIIWTIAAGMIEGSQTILHKYVVSATAVTAGWGVHLHIDLDYVCA
jgi:hypothetical protein